MEVYFINRQATILSLNSLNRFKKKIMDAEELLRRYAAGERNFAGVDLFSGSGRLNLKGADLRGINLRGAMLHFADLSGANLSDAQLIGANLEHIVLREADLSRANLEGANLKCANLDSANLNYACLNYANLYLTSLKNSNLLYAELRWCILIKTDLHGAKDLNLSNMSGLIVWYVTLPDGSFEKGPKSQKDSIGVDSR